jgi:CRISPR system Cascade subunit CasE
MHLSKLILNPSPAARQVLRDLASPYEMHRTILRAFPSHDDGGPGRVLFRLEPPTPDQPPVVLVQSDKPPKWDALDALPGYLLSAEVKQFDPGLPTGRKLRFRLRANPTVKRDGKRHGLLDDQAQFAWLIRKGQASGFHPMDFTVRRSGNLTSRRSSDDGPSRQTHLAVDYEGILEVTDAEAFTKALAAGIGPAKAFGFGLLSIAPISS